MLLTNDENVIELVDSIDFREKLVDHCIVNCSAARDGSSRLTDGVNFIKDDDMKTAVGTHLSKQKNDENEIFMPLENKILSSQLPLM